MLYPYRHPGFCWWFTRVIQRRLRATFAQVSVHGTAHVRALEGPVLMVANHSSYWDTLLISWLSEHVLRTPGYAWMHAHNLIRLPFFRLLGAFGVDGRSAADVKAGLTFVVERLRGSPCALWIFPQGDEKPHGRRPLGFAGGSAWIARRCPNTRVVPVALHYTFGPREKPLARVCFGAPMPAGADTTEAHEAAVTRLLDACVQEDPALADLSPGRLVYGPDQDASREPFATRCLSAMSRWYLRRRLPLRRRAT